MKFSAFAMLVATVSAAPFSFSLFASAPVDPLSTLNATIDSKISETMHSIEPQLERILMINGTQFATDLVAEFDHFRDVIVKKVQTEVAEAIAGAKSAGVPLSMEDMMKLVDALHDQLDHLVQVEVKDWSEKELKAWAQKAEKAWVGIERPVVDKIRQFLDFVKRHSPGRGSSACQIPPPVVPQSKHTKDSKAVSYNFGPKASSKVVEDIEEEQAYDGAQEFDTAQDDGAFEYEEYAPESFALTKRSWPTAVVGIVSALGGVVLGLTIAAIAVVMAIMSIHW